MADIPKNIKSTAIGLHTLFADVYGEKRNVSDILHSFGFTEYQVNTLKTEKITAFYENIKFALACRFLHYSGGHRLLFVLFRRYGLFDYPKETLEGIGDSMGISRERVRQLEKKAMKRLIGGVSSDAVGILIVLAACKTLDVDAMDLLRPAETERDADDEEAAAPPDLPTLDLPHADFYIQGGFNYTSKRGRYQLLMTFGDYTKYFEKKDLEGHSDVSMILLAVIEGLEKLKKPCAVMVHSNTIFGISAIYKDGKLRMAVPEKTANYELKEHIRKLLSENGHALENIADSNIRERIKAWSDSNA